jgi:hypothetical protein
MKNFSNKVVEKIKTHFMFSNFFFFRKSWLLWENVGKYCRTGQATDDGMAHAHFMLDTQGYKYTQVVEYLLLLPYNNVYTNTPQPVLLFSS